MRLLGLAAVGLLVLAPPRAHAQSCNLGVFAGVAFGPYDVFAASPVVAVGTIAYTCTDVLPADTVVIEVGGAPDAATLRTMTSGARTLGYQLYLDAARTNVWGTGAGGTVVYGPVQPATGTTNVSIYGRLPARQNARAGSYSGTVVVTLQF